MLGTDRAQRYADKRKRRAGVGASPFQVSAVSAWLRNTATSGGVTSVTDLLNSNPAVQGPEANQPTGTTSANGLPCLSFDGTDDFLSWPIIANTIGSPRWGYAAWVRPATVSSVHTIYACRGLTGASATRLELQQNGTDLFVNVAISNVSIRRGTASAVFALNTWAFITVEYDGAQSSEADECIITVNGVKQTLAFVDDTGTPGDMPDTLVQPTGNAAIGDIRVASPLLPWHGLIGPNQFILKGAGGISGGGLITAGQRTILMNFEAPT
jgi:hypothetical protein